MFHIRSYTLAFLLSWSVTMMSQSHDFEIRDFHENLTDLTAATSKVKDLNGLTAALVRFAVRDTLFSFDANMGILKQLKKTGEVLLFVPHGTKRITISHPHLGVLRDYEPSVAISTKKTYDADIFITNVAYLNKLMGVDQPQQIITTPEKAKEPSPVVKPVAAKEPKDKQSHAPMSTHFALGAGYNALSINGFTASVGLELGMFFVEADFIYGIEQIEGVGIYYYKSGITTLGEAYDYSASRATLRLGVNINPKSIAQLIPQAGASMTMITGKEIVNNLNDDAQFSKSNSISVFAAISLRFKLTKTLYFQITPQYNLAVGADDVYNIIKDADNKIKAWGEGFGVNAGILCRF